MPLPPGLLLNPATGEVTGTPTVAGVFPVQLKVRDTLGTSRVVDESITINNYTPMSFTAGYARMMATRVYASTPTLVGGLAPITFALQTGALPTGLSLNAATGELTGTPTTPGAVAFTIRATDALGQTEDLPETDPVAANLTLGYSLTNGTVGVAYSKAATTGGGTTPYSYAVTAGALPAGLGLNAATGAVTGTPTTPGASSGIGITVTDAFGFTAVASALVITIVTPVSLTGALGRGTVGTAYSQSYTANNGQTPFAWTLDSGTLPTGLSLNAVNGAITGNPAAAGTFNPVIRITDALGNTTTRMNPITIAATLDISGTPPGGTINVPYTFTPTVTGGWIPYSFAPGTGDFPNGLSLDPVTGELSGTPTLADAFSGQIVVTDADGNTDTLTVNITIGDTLELTGDTPDLGTTTVAYSGTTFGVSGGQAPYSWSIFAGALPTGLSINGSTGDITGTPTVPGTYNFTVRVTDAQLSREDSVQQIIVAAFPALSGTATDASNGVAYSFTYTRTGGHLPLAYDISAGALPTGLSINAATGAITGTPSADGVFNFTVRLTDDEGNITTRAGTITVYALPVLSGGYTAETETKTSGGTDGLAYSDGITLTGGKSPVSFALIGGTLPGGLSLNSSTGLISGTANYISSSTSPGFSDFSFTVRATDALGQFDDLSGSIRAYYHIEPPATIYASGTVTVPYSELEAFKLGKTPYNHVVTSGALPNGLSLNAVSGAITGTPTVASTFNFTITATDALGKTAAKAFSVVINPAVAIGNPAPDSFTSTPYTHTYTKSGGNGVYSFATVSGSVPPGLSLSSAGVLSGNPTTPGTYNFTVRVTSAGDTADLPESVVITQLLTVSISDQSITGSREIEANPFPPPGTIRGNGEARYELQASGQARRGESDTNGVLNFTNIINEWLQAGAASGAQVEMVWNNTSGISGSPSGSGVWTTLGSGTVGWTLSSGTASTTRTGTCRLRRTSDGVVLDTATITLTIGF